MEIMASKRTPIACFAAWTKDEELLMQSSSGGVFSELAKVVLAEGGVVFGAGWEPGSFRVVHRWVETEKELAELRGSAIMATPTYQQKSVRGVRPMEPGVGTRCPTLCASFVKVGLTGSVKEKG